jgi:hypothetical protein
MNTTTSPRVLFWQACGQRVVWLRAAKLGFVVGVIQVGLNQGDHWLRHEIDTAVIVKTILSPLISFAIALISAAATYAGNLPPPSSSS